MTATSFEGFLNSYEVRGPELELRFAAGGFDPFPVGLPILYVLVRGPGDLARLRADLDSRCGLDDGAYVEPVSEMEALIHLDHGEPLCLRGESISFRPAPYDHRDFERLARANHMLAQSAERSWRAAQVRLASAQGLVHDQALRLQAKCQGHAPGSTARTLYEQHLWFLERLGRTLKD